MENPVVIINETCKGLYGEVCPMRIMKKDIRRRRIEKEGYADGK